MFPKLEKVQSFAVNTLAVGIACSQLEAYKEQGGIEQSLDRRTLKDAGQAVSQPPFSTGGKIGIRVSVGVGVFLVAALLALVVRRCLRRYVALLEERVASGGDHGVQEGVQETAELGSTAVTSGGGVSGELTGIGCSSLEGLAAGELDSMNEVYELPPNGHSAELSGDGHRDC